MGLSDSDRRQIARLVDALDHPDAVHQREIMDLLVDMGPDCLDPLIASLGLVPPRVQTSIVRVLGELGDERALVPLMRFVFDQSGVPLASDARALAMKAIAHLASPDDAKRVFAFLLDVHDDDDPFVRGYAYAAMGRFGDRRAVPILEAALKDDEEFVQERATKALARLESSDSNALESSVDDDELLRKLRGAKGGEREYWLNELLARPTAFDMARELVEEGGRGALLGLQLLQKLDDPRARGVALRLAQSTSDSDRLSIALRIVAQFLRGDATPEELQVTKLALYSEDRFVRLAALGVAGASGERELMERALAAASDPDVVVAATAAEALARGTGPRNRRILPELITAAKRSLQSRDGDSDEAVRTRAFLLRAMKNVVSEGGFGVGDAQGIALDLLAVEDARPIVITGLELLEVTTQNGGGPIPNNRAVALAEFLDHEQQRVRDRAFEILERAAPSGFEPLLEPLSRRLYDSDPEETERVLRVIERIGTRRAIEMIERVARESDGGVKLAAEAALRRIRSGDEYIDATFEAAGAAPKSDAPKNAENDPGESDSDDWGSDDW